jgi:hypothetical protein
MNDVNIIIPLAVLGGLLIIGVLIIIIKPWNMLARRYADKPQCAAVYVDIGKGYDCVDGRRIYHGPEGDIYHFKYAKAIHEVRTGSNYPYKYIERARVIYALLNSIYAQPLPGHYEKECQLGEAEVGTQTLGYIVTELDASLRNMGGPGFSTWLIIIIIIVVIAAGVIFFVWRSHSGAAPLPLPTTTPTTTPGSLTPLPQSALNLFRLLAGV